MKRLAYFCITALIAGCFSSGKSKVSSVKRQNIATAIAPHIQKFEFPRELPVSPNHPEENLIIRYAMDLPSQLFMEKTLSSYRPDYGAFVAIDAETGRVVTMSSYVHDAAEREIWGNLSLRSTFPAASVFKLVTATAAIDGGKAEPDTLIEFNGSNHTLYKNNVLKDKKTRWTRSITLSEAFAKSVNTVFAKVGLNLLAPLELQTYAKRYRFNQMIGGDFLAEGGQFELPEYSRWAVAEAASGYYKQASLSPLQGALMASAVVNDGVMMEPYIVDSVLNRDGDYVYRASKRSISVVMSEKSAGGMRELMRDTIRRGTSRKSFRRFGKTGVELEVGGKTGSLTGQSPLGKYDWFVGYGMYGGRKVAVAALTVNRDLWRVKASFLARMFFEQYFREDVKRGLATTGKGKRR